MRRKKLLVLSRYDKKGASSRLRTLQYLPYLSAAGFDITVSSFFDDAYLERLYSGRSRGLGALRYFVRRLQQMRAARDADLIWVEKEVLPWAPWLIERFFYPRHVPLISDYDDAVFHRYDLHRRWLVRNLLGQKIDCVMRRSTTVFAGNTYLAGRARDARAPRIDLVPTVVDVQAYGYRASVPQDGKLRVGWIGTPETWMEFGLPMLAILQKTMAVHDSLFCAVGAGKPSEPLSCFEYLDWSEDSEVALIRGMDIGIMPLPDTPWARGKCGYKLIQYMACGLPVVASPVGVNKEIVEHGVNGLFAETEAEWREALTTLLGDPKLRRRMGEAGRKKVELEYSLQVYGPKVAAIMYDIAQNKCSGN